MLTSRNAEGMSARFEPALQTCVNLSLLQPRLLLWSQMRTPTTHQLEKKNIFIYLIQRRIFKRGNLPSLRIRSAHLLPRAVWAWYANSMSTLNGSVMV